MDATAQFDAWLEAIGPDDSSIQEIRADGAALTKFAESARPWKRVISAGTVDDDGARTNQ